MAVYYPHLLIHPEYQDQGIGRLINRKLKEKYGHFHMQILTANKKSIEFYKKMDFEKTKTQPMGIYKGNEH